VIRQLRTGLSSQFALVYHYITHGDIMMIWFIWVGPILTGMACAYCWRRVDSAMDSAEKAFLFVGGGYAFGVCLFSTLATAVITYVELTR
jgi:hypothetical protein